MYSNLTITSTRMSQPAASTVPSPFVHEENALFVGIAFESIFYGALQSSSNLYEPLIT